ncbi:MAG: ribosomal-protein-alanine acetyltransferase [Cobetia sp.]|jgi:ribosomal-protein-alanine N-acetyltransferase|uniref:GNAT family N-acetyltransferase n=1 Tax=Cobetia TaxID=204286 RepID=UPI000C4D19B5|nr:MULTISPECIES: GNAT family N-acetyltransferase [Cobetia]MBF09053.1 ribosomal-protein-alanine acetyltransferase [Cobetia sp.]MBK10256.1 ribosomal-protein-alanine acetyltransferase [Cobetia sp.]UBU48439.1 GNAT family N-acetyltransferase [Cobetia amphilecti]HAR06945.1 ribosomal-protein-alanine acetyltransferase [Cobetia sp.]HBJ29157.1 ribosomal-protein-alanine acetyltransferase [Cobetia sp.]|tara:strand:+ start:19770 stop:20288 length:519 start_codon:yes stop_codon:yes gene_type:complete
MSESAARRLELRELADDQATLLALEAIEASQAHGLSQSQLIEVLNDDARCVLGAWWQACESSGGEASTAELIGFVVLARGPFEAEIEAITVHAAQRGQGVGARLLAAAIAQARDWQRDSGLERLLLEVRASNAAAAALYAKAGFTRDGVRKGYYPLADGGREDAWLMSLPLV